MPCRRALLTLFLFGVVAVVISSKCTAALCLVHGRAASWLVLAMPCKAAGIFFFFFRSVFVVIVSSGPFLELTMSNVFIACSVLEK